MKKVLKPFKFGTMKTAADFEKTMTEAGLPFPVDENVDILAKPIQIGDKIVPKALTVSRTEAPPISSAAATRDTPAAARA